MAWIESHQTVWEHAKTRKAARRLGIPAVQLVGHLHALWHWAIDHAEDGNLSKYDTEDIAIAARWDGDPDEFVDALTHCGPGDSAGFLERGGAYGDPGDSLVGELVLHDWWDYAGKLIDRRRKDRERKAARRSKDTPEDVLTTSDGSPDNSPADSRSRVTEPTQPTEPNQPTPTSGKPDGGDPDVSEDAKRLTRQFAEAVKANGHAIPTRGTKARDQWLIEMDRLLRLGPPGEGGHIPDPDEVATVIAWCANDRGDDRYPGESVNVRSVPKFRERYSQLRAKALAVNGARAGPARAVSTFAPGARNF